MIGKSSRIFVVVTHGACVLVGVLLALWLLPSASTPAPSAPSAPTSHPAVASAPATDENAGNASSTQAADLAKQLADTNAKLERTRQELAKKENSLAQSEAMVEGLFDDALKQAQDDIKKGVKNSAFATLDDSSLYLGQLNKRALLFAQKYPTVPPAGTPERAEYDKEMAEITGDAQSIMQDSRLLGVFLNGDVPGIARSTALQMQGEFDLNAGQVAAVNSILSTAYSQGFAEQLNGAHRPTGDATAWQNARVALQNQTNVQLQSILTPVQLAQFNRPGGAYQMWSLTVAGH